MDVYGIVQLQSKFLKKYIHEKSIKILQSGIVVLNITITAKMVLKNIEFMQK